MNIYWLNLIGSGVLAIGMTSSARFISGYQSFWPSLLFFNFLILSWLLLERAAMGVPWGTAFAVWAGIAPVGTILVEVLVFGETIGVGQWFFLAVMSIGVIGYTYTSIY
jgi:quaternary ammonium compound-resistance protein SugE